MTTGERIAAARRRIDRLTQEKLAEWLGVSPQAVSSWERDECLPDTKNLTALADALDVPLDPLLREKPDWELKPVNDSPEHMFTFVKGRAQTRCLPQTLQVLDVMRAAHSGQCRKSKYGFKTDYAAHPLTMACHALAMGLEDDDVLAAALAHDLAEDTGTRVSDIPANERVREAVRLVSKNECDQGRPDWERIYYEEIGKNPLACLIKCLDRVNNLSGMADGFRYDRLARYTKETDRYYPALLDVIKKVPEWNNAWWLLRYQMRALTETFKRLL